MVPNHRTWARISSGNMTLTSLQATVLTASPKPELLADFYEYLTIFDATFDTAERKKHLSLRLRDVLLKMVCLVGAPQVLCALIPLAKAEGQPAEQAGSSTLSEKWFVVHSFPYPGTGKT